MKSEDKKYLSYLQGEREASRMYRALAELTSGDPREALLELAEIEDRHAAHWVTVLERRGVSVPPDHEQFAPESAEILERAKKLSLAAVLPELEAAEREAQGTYDQEPEAYDGMAEDERIHAQVLQAMLSGQPVAALPTKSTQSGVGSARDTLNSAEPWHKADKSGSARAAVFGASDGLVSNAALVMGFAGGQVDNSTVLFAGIAGLLAGAFSMAAGEYVSVSSQRDLFRREIALEAEELREKPLEEERELELIYRAKGVDKETAKQVASQVMKDPKTALDTLVREELGLDVDDLGSPVKAAAFSFGAFAVGATVPVLPYLFGIGSAALYLAIALVMLALVIVGGAVGYTSGAGVVKSAMRQLLVGVAAAAVTYGVGALIGVNVS